MPTKNCFSYFYLQTARERLDAMLPRLARAAALQEELSGGRQLPSTSAVDAPPAPAHHASAKELRRNSAALWRLRRQQSDLGRRLDLKCRELEAQIEMLPQFKER